MGKLKSSSAKMEECLDIQAFSLRPLNMSFNMIDHYERPSVEFKFQIKFLPIDFSPNKLSIIAFYIVYEKDCILASKMRITML